MTNLFHFRGFDIPVDLIQKTGAGPEAFEPIADNQIALLKEYIGLKDTDHVMEIGCGIGRGAIPLTELLEHGDYIGTDTIAPSIKWCTQNISVRFPNFGFVHHDIRDTLHNPTGTLQAFDVRLPAGDDSTDLIIPPVGFYPYVPRRNRALYEGISAYFKAYWAGMGNFFHCASGNIGRNLQ